MDSLKSKLDEFFAKNGGIGDDWKEINRIVSGTKAEVTILIDYLSPILRNLNNTSNQILGLDLLDYLMDENNTELHEKVAKKEFFGLIVKIFKFKDPEELVQRVHYLVKKWGLKFQDNASLSKYAETYDALVQSGIKFPADTEMNSKYNKYLFIEKQASPVKKPLDDGKLVELNPTKDYSFLDLNPEHYEKKYRKFCGELDGFTKNMLKFNLMIGDISSKTIKQLDSKDFTSFYEQLKEIEANLIYLIQTKITDDKLLKLCLGLSEDLTITFSRYDCAKKGYVPTPFTSFFEGGKPISAKEFAHLKKY